ncbi:MAG: DivIVA domain-containing protein [Actinobacteria bacterium]|nr:DivIVA domain-containing protein [Actinomycetota bacterium]
MQDVALGAEEVASKEFPVSFRGFHQHEVRAFLAQVAAELAAARERERSQRHRLETAEAKAASRVLTDDEIEAALGEEAGRVLHAAREAARDIRARAEEQVARLVREASGEGSRAEQEAESLLARRSEEAERVAAEITAEARRQAEAELERAKAEGRQMVAEAQAVRERVLKDLARRRKAAHQHLEQLRAGRERLLEAYRVVRTTLDEATSELSVAEAEARAAAETASLRMASQPETTVEELEAELSAARDLGLGPLPPPPASPKGHGASNGNGAQRHAPPLDDRPRDEPAPLVVADAPPEAVMVPPTTPEPVLHDTSATFDPLAPPPPAEELVEHSDLAEALEPAEVDEEAEPPEEPLSAPSEREHPNGGVDDLFARLRAEQTRPEPESTAAPGPASASAPTNGSESASTNGSESTPAVGARNEDSAADDDEELLQRRDAELEPVERILVKSLKRTLADEQNEVLDTLRRRRGLASLDELLPEASDHTARYLAVADPVLVTAAGLGAGERRDPPPVTDLAVALAAAVVEDLRARLQRVLEAADGDEAAQAEGISSAYREWKTARVEPLARHHSAAAHTRGRFAATPEGTLRWVVDAEEGPCPDCDDNALALTPKGGVFPTGQRHPPAHLGCRCTIVTGRH